MTTISLNEGNHIVILACNKFGPECRVVSRPKFGPKMFSGTYLHTHASFLDIIAHCFFIRLTTFNQLMVVFEADNWAQNLAF